MGLRFRKSVKIAPGIRVNFGKKGSSLSIGGRGATVNLSKKGTRTTIGIPGTGLSYSEYKKHNSSTETKSLGIGTIFALAFIILILAMIFR